MTVDQLTAPDVLPLLDMSFFARPDWARESVEPFSGTVRFGEAEMVAPKTREAYPGEDLFPSFTVELSSHDQTLIPRRRGLIDTRPEGESYWDVFVGDGAVWREEGDGGWSRASLPLNLVARYVGEVRNCVATFVYREDAMSNVAVQCSQETAVLDAQQLGDVRAMAPAAYEPRSLPDGKPEASRIPTAPLAEIDRERAVADHFDRTIWTNASTSLGAVYLDGTLYVHPPRTRHGVYPYPGAMRHGVFSVTKSMAGALAMFYFAERYGEEIFEARIADYVPAFADLREWQGVTFSQTLNMVTGVRSGEDLLYEPLELAPDKEAAIGNIAQFGDFPEAPGEKFNYATTNTFVLSYALENYVKEREDDGVHYWDLVRENVLDPIGAGDFGLLLTRDEDPSQRIPILGLGAYPNLDNAAKIARLLANEGEHEGRQLLSRRRVREALGRAGWEGYAAFEGLRYSHSFWLKIVRTGGCDVRVAYMEGLGDNRVIFFPSGLISFQFTDELDKELDEMVRAVEGIRSSCR
ncbi:MAG: serine hydrolase [Bryobacterales bacterium]|nr:serine hydrolase [Acidobacteriota bacterium]MCB9384163.1 serine hydrolase [Bryobacterales bacterium]